MDERPADTKLSGFQRLLHPRSIAVIGGREAAEVIRQCRRMGYSGLIYPVHPRHEKVEGVPCFRTLADLPEVPDAAFVAVRRELSIDVVRELAAMGAGGAICYASGFRETGGAGEDLQAALVEASGDMPILGPNCYGLINYLEGALLWPDQHGGQRRERGVAILTQSGNMAINLTMNQRGLPIAFLVAMGNQAKVGLAAMADALLEDPRVSAIGLHIEGLGDAAAFVTLAAKARARGVPLVALKVGRSEAAAALTFSHTASLAGADAVADAFLRRLGIGRVHNVPAFLETLKLLHQGGPLTGRDLASMSCSGGEASLIADAIDSRKLRFRSLDLAQRQRVKDTLSDLVHVSNPLDYHTFIWADETRMTETFAAMLGCGFDLSFLILDFPRADRCETHDWDITLRALEAASRRTGGRCAVVASLPENLPEARAEDILARGMIPFGGIEEALTAAEVAAAIGDAWRRDWPEPVTIPPLMKGEAVSMSEWAAKQRLRAAGLTLPRGGLAANAAEAMVIAESLGFPVVLKAVGEGLAHKSELGAVRLGLADADSVAHAAEELLPMGSGLLVEEMIGDGLAEVIVGCQRDPVIGPYLLLGSGGVLVELIADSVLLPLPASRAEIEEGLSRLKVAQLLAGYRGKPPGDRAALIAAVEAIQRFALSEAGRLIELDVNPVIVRPQGKGVVAVDAFMRIVKGEKNG
ncbi:acetate--CoA ligase family protein [Limibacillus sp. MBR-115]|jgi:acyl-CoA synthetase (NDP forming)|uniref:acetate--CoA ligase family protein n=1 Tax=Limibacillus sp. MBR-115 TaxID=3156465 RepID=UPI00339B5BB2